MLKYCLRENLLTPDENDYMAQTADVRSFSLDEIIDLMMQKGSTLTKADTKATLQVYGEVTGTANTTLTKGGVVQLVGARLKFDAKDAAQGIFFVPKTGEAVRAAVIAENKPARLMAIIPADLAAGTYYIEVRTKILEGNKSGKTLKTGRFNKALTVAE